MVDKKFPVSPFAPSRRATLPPIEGLRVAVAAAQERYQNRDDFVLFALNDESRCAILTSKNSIRAAPVLCARQHLAEQIAIDGGQGLMRGLLVNAGNANSFTGATGFEHARLLCRQAAQFLNCAPRQVLPASTGVIGEPLNIEALTTALDNMSNSLKPLTAALWEKAAQAITTTDTFPKLAASGGGKHGFSIAGIAKGSGMIAPNMATMLAFIFTDAALEPQALRTALRIAADLSFQQISVDGDGSTNDMVALVATGKKSVRRRDFIDELTLCCRSLASQIVQDGEGASRLMRVGVRRARTHEEARKIARSIVESLLVKTALAGGDPNWGRILMAIGKTQIPLDVNRLELHVGGLPVIASGARHPDYDEVKMKALFAERTVEITVTCHAGEGHADMQTCDLTHGYVDINADYRS